MHRGRNQAVAVLAHAPPESLSLGSHHEGRRQAEIDGIVPLPSRDSEPHRPDTQFFELVDGPGDVHHAGHLDVSNRAGRGFGRSASESGGSSGLHDDAVSAGSIGWPQTRANVVRILYTVEVDDQGWAAGCSYASFARAFLRRFDHRRHALMHAGAAIAIENGRIDGFDRDIPRGCQFENFLESRPAPLRLAERAAADPQLLDTSRPKRLEHRVDTIDDHLK